MPQAEYFVWRKGKPKALMLRSVGKVSLAANIYKWREVAPENTIIGTIGDNGAKAMAPCRESGPQSILTTAIELQSTVAGGLFVRPVYATSHDYPEYYPFGDGYKGWGSVSEASYAEICGYLAEPLSLQGSSSS